MKKNFLEKLGLIETSESEEGNSSILPEEMLETDVSEKIPEVPVQFSSDDVLTIEGIYTSNDVNDLSQTVYKVKEMIDTLPKEMPDKTKQTTVCSMMNVIGLSIDSILGDAKNRVSILHSAFEAKNRNLTKDLNDNEMSIEALKQEIENRQKRSQEIQKAIKENENTISKELEKISYITEFIGGEKE